MLGVAEVFKLDVQGIGIINCRKALDLMWKGNSIALNGGKPFPIRCGNTVGETIKRCIGADLEVAVSENKIIVATNY